MHVPAGDAPIFLLVNRAAGGGRSGARADAVERALQSLGPVVRHDTRGPGDEARIARDAADGGGHVLAVVGGDGSVSHAARGLLAASHPLPMAIFGAGTGNDFAKSLGAPVHNIGAMIACIARGRTRSVDVGFVDDVPFVNAAGFGFDVHVLERMRTPSIFRGTGAYVITALRALVGFRGFVARLHDESTSHTVSHTPEDAPRRLMLVVANGRYFGGAFHIAPGAVLDNGQLDAVMINDASTGRRLALFAMALRGAHLRETGVYSRRGRSFQVEFAQPPAFEADGELYQARESVVQVLVRPGALQMVV